MKYLFLLLFISVLASACGGSSSSSEEPTKKEDVKKNTTDLVDTDNPPTPPPQPTVRNEITGDSEEVEVTDLSDPEQIANLQNGRLANLWEIRDGVVVENETDISEVAAPFILDIQECGLSFDGPNCLEGGEKSFAHAQIVEILGVQYYYVSVDYTPISTNVGLFFRLNDDSENGGISVYPFLITDPNFKHSVEQVVTEKSAAYLGKFYFNPLTLEFALEESNKENSSRGYVHLLNWLHNVYLYDIVVDEDKAKLKKELLTLIATPGKEHILDESRGVLVDTYLSVSESLLDTVSFVGVLEELAENERTLAAEESAMRWLKWQINNRKQSPPGEETEEEQDKFDAHIDKYQRLTLQALSRKDVSTLKRALETIILADIELEDIDIQNVFKLVGVNDRAVSTTAHRYINSFLQSSTFEPEYYTYLKDHVVNSDKFELGAKLSLDLLASYGQKRELTQVLLELLGVNSKPTRLLIYDYVTNLGLELKNDHIIFLDKHYNSEHIDTRLKVIDYLSIIDTKESTTELILQLDELNVEVRDHLVATLNEKDFFPSPHHIILSQHFNSTLPEVRIQTGVFMVEKFGDALAADSLLKNLNDSDEVVRDKFKELLLPLEFNDGLRIPLIDLIYSPYRSIQEFTLKQLYPKLRTELTTNDLIQKLCITDTEIRDWLRAEISERDILASNDQDLHYVSIKDILETQTCPIDSIVFTPVLFEKIINSNLQLMADSKEEAVKEAAFRIINMTLTTLIQQLVHNNATMRAAVVSVLDKSKFEKDIHPSILRKAYFDSKEADIKANIIGYLTSINSFNSTRDLIGLLNESNNNLREQTFAEVVKRIKDAKNPSNYHIFLYEIFNLGTIRTKIDAIKVLLVEETNSSAFIIIDFYNEEIVKEFKVLYIDTVAAYETKEFAKSVLQGMRTKEVDKDEFSDPELVQLIDEKLK